MLMHLLIVLDQFFPMYPPDGNEKLIAYVSGTLFFSKRNFTQIEKEALSLLFGVKIFYLH